MGLPVLANPSTASLRRKPTPARKSPKAFEYFNDPFVLVTTPVEEGREEEYVDHIAYSSSYTADLVSYLKSNGFKPHVGYTFDNDTAEADFTVLLSGLAHVLLPMSYQEFSKLLDLEHEYDFYHITLNEVLFTVLPAVLRGNALAIFHEVAETNPTDGRFALQRLRYEVEGVPDPDRNRF
ncbi:hypothetical protein CYMTET_21562 [Cymbomonas tetramitiformis]|uniref:Uncharacterized protein n=1 Tax=Cymbomonas tetramitiformis TaxID=36881 RepID=A0AAE0L324_9CHLO|nr:hypothetical protein CYMTET_21562 [Cymbomonas tetramitiformis]